MVKGLQPTLDNSSWDGIQRVILRDHSLMLCFLSFRIVRLINMQFSMKKNSFTNIHLPDASSKSD